MNMTTKKEIFREKLDEYLKGNRREKSAILDAVIAVIPMVRKSAIRRFRSLQLQDPTKSEGQGRPRYYTNDVIAALKAVWELGNEACGENLHPMIGEYVAALISKRTWNHSDETTGKLHAMSLGSVKHYVSRFVRVKYPAKGRGTTKPSAIQTQIPIRRDGWETAPPGTVQIDTVAHCNDSVAGDFIYTLNMTDVTTFWGDRRAQWNKGQTATVANIDWLSSQSPIPLVELHPDSGCEFINWHCMGYCDEHNLKLTRSRPNRKNDNCFVEERNGHVVRRYIGYTRLDVRTVVGALNAVYDVLTPYLNHFVASRRILSKERIGSRWKVTREKIAKTPYQRILERTDVSTEVKEKLREVHASLNVVDLKQEIDRRLKLVFAIQRRHGKQAGAGKKIG